MGRDPWGAGSRIQRLGINGSREFMVRLPWAGGSIGIQNGIHCTVQVGLHGERMEERTQHRDPWEDQWELKEGYGYRSVGRPSAGGCVQGRGSSWDLGKCTGDPERVKIHQEKSQSRG